MNTKSLAFALALGVAGSASAVTLNFQSTGNFAPSVISATDLTKIGGSAVTLAGFPSDITFVGFAYAYGGPGMPTATTSFSNGTGLLFLNSLSLGAGSLAVDFSGTYGFKSVGGSVFSESMGTTSATLTGSGFLSGYTGTAIFSNTGLVAGGTDRTSFSGTFNPVPEPASMAALTVGGLGLLRRRRKA